MKREQVADEAANQYRQLGVHDGVRHTYLTKTLPPNPYRSSLETIKLENHRERQIRYRDTVIAQLNTASRALYREHPSELHEMAMEEMEAEGIDFNFANAREETVYRFGEEIADLEEVSPLNALGAKVVHIAQKHIGLAEEALAQA